MEPEIVLKSRAPNVPPHEHRPRLACRPRAGGRAGIESAAAARVCVAHRTPPPGENDIEFRNDA
jgi:hypothetical protein